MSVAKDYTTLQIKKLFHELARKEANYNGHSLKDWSDRHFGAHFNDEDYDTNEPGSTV